MQKPMVSVNLYKPAMEEFKMRTFNKTIGIETGKSNSVILKWESWKSDTKESETRKDITTNEKLFLNEEEMFDFIMNNYKVRPTDIELVESALKSIERASKKAWYPLQRLVKAGDKTFSPKIYSVIKNAFISHLARISGFDFTQLLTVNPSKLVQYDPDPTSEEIADLAKV